MIVKLKLAKSKLLISFIIVPLSLALGFENDFYFVLVFTSFLSFFIYIISNNNNKIYLNAYIYIILFFIFIFGIYGFGNPIFLKDFKLPLLWIGYYIIFLHIICKNLSATVHALFISNVLVTLFYLQLYYFDIYNPYSNSEIPAYTSYRILGPALTGYFIIPFIYALYNLKHDRLYFYNFLLGIVGIFLNGSLQSIAIFSIAYLCSYIYIKNFKEVILKAFTLLICVLSVIIITAQFSQPFKSKLRQLINPLQSPSVMTRLYDLAYMLNETTDTSKEVAFGSGFGVQSNVKRVNLNTYNKIVKNEFHEIDNGFFYIYHRCGLVGLTLIILLFVIMFFKISSFKSRIIFASIVFITNLLSIHFWVYPIYSIFLSSIVNSFNKK